MKPLCKSEEATQEGKEIVAKEISFVPVTGETMELRGSRGRFYFVCCSCGEGHLIDIEVVDDDGVSVVRLKVEECSLLTELFGGGKDG